MKKILYLLVIALFIAAVPVQAADVTVPSASYDIKKTTARSLTFAAADTTKSFTIEANAWVHSVLVTTPNWANNSTATLTIVNADSKTIYTAAALAESTDHVLQDFVGFGYLPLSGTNTFTLTLSGAPGGTGGVATVTIYLFER